MRQGSLYKENDLLGEMVQKNYSDEKVIPPKSLLSHFMGYLKGKISTIVAILCPGTGHTAAYRRSCGGNHCCFRLIF